MSSNHEFSEGLWLGGGIRWETLARVELALRKAAEVCAGYDTPEVVQELNNMANAARADLQKRPPPAQTWSKYL